MNWALIGASTIASQYMIRAIRSVPGGQVIRVVSGSAERGAVFAAEHGIAQSGTDLSTALADNAVDAVYISSTNDQHFAQAMAAIAKGKHVLCEKPLAMTLDEAIQMVRAARTKGVTFGTNHHLRCAGSHRAAQDLILSGVIGTVLSVRIFHAVHLPASLRGWRIDSAAAGGGVVPDITVHDADVVRTLLGESPVSVIAEATSAGMGQGVEDSAMSVWMMPSGAMVQSHESFVHPHAGSGFEVHGTRGSIFGAGVMTQEPVGEVTLVTDAGREAVPFATADLYTTGVAAFCEAVAGRGRPAADGWDGVRSLAVALAVREAAVTGRRVMVDYGVAA